MGLRVAPESCKILYTRTVIEFRALYSFRFRLKDNFLSMNRMRKIEFTRAPRTS